MCLYLYVKCAQIVQICNASVVIEATLDETVIENSPIYLQSVTSEGHIVW